MYPFILAVAGILSHRLYFRHGEHHFLGVKYLQVFVLAVVSTSVYYQYVHDLAWSRALLTAAAYIFLPYLAGLYGSLVVYRVFLHPLRRFPGPGIARVSSLWSISPTHTNHFNLVALHKQYGPIVRTDPSRLSIILPSAVPIIYGAQSACTKDTWYNLGHPNRSLLNVRSRAEHAPRRRIWSYAFSEKRVRGYEERIRVYQQQFITQLERFDESDTPIDICKWFKMYNFDVMGDLAFGRGFDCLIAGQEHWSLTLLNKVMYQVGVFFPTWLFLVCVAIPGARRDWWRLLDFCAGRLDQRIREGKSRSKHMDSQTETYLPDISESLLAPFQERSPTPRERLNLEGDVRLVVVAGSDTTATTLSGVFYELARHPEEVAKLRAELAPYATGADKGVFLASQIAHLDHLNGVINEAMRLWPAVPGPMHRKTPEEGIEVDGTYIPGNMTVACPQYIMARSELGYERPDEFIPERWYKDPSLVKDASGFFPFSIGPQNCIERPLALVNLRTTIARLIMTFDMELAPGEDGRAFVEKAQDNFVLYPGQMNVRFKKRCG